MDVCVIKDTFTNEESIVVQKTKHPIEAVNTETSSVTTEQTVEAKQSHLLTEEASTVLQSSRQSIEIVKPVLSVTTEKNVEAKQNYLPPDPRAACFFVGTRVEGLLDWMGRIPGTVKELHPRGYVDVLWDDYGYEPQIKVGGGRLWLLE